MSVLLLNADARQIPLADETVQCVITSPPYFGLRNYGVDGQIGLERTVNDYVEELRLVFQEVWRVLRPDGTVWLNLGDTYAGSGNGAWNVSNPERWGKHYYKRVSPREYIAPPRREEKSLRRKNILGVPWRVAFALQADGWILRQDLIWHKTNTMPESVRDRFTQAHEYIFLLTKSERYYWNYQEALLPAKSVTLKRYRRGYRSEKAAHFKGFSADKSMQFVQKQERIGYCNSRSVLTLATSSFHGAHFAVFPPRLIEPFVRIATRPEDLILDPFCGSGTVGLVALQYGRRFVGIDLNRQYLDLATRRIRDDGLQSKIERGGVFQLPLFA